MDFTEILNINKVMLLKNKNAVIYGAGGAIGGAVARAFALAGARVFVTGRKKQPLEDLVKDIVKSGGRAEMALVDALDEQVINKHLDTIVGQAGPIDISFNAVGIAHTGIQGIPIVDLPVGNYMLPILTYAKTNFLTAKAAARHMLLNKSGVILTITATPARLAYPQVGGMPASWAAIEALSRNLAAELGPQGIRVNCIRSNGIPETPLLKEVMPLHAKVFGMPDFLEFQAVIESKTLSKELPKLTDIANWAVFMASDQAQAMTGSIINLTCGEIVD
jgi:NAD(P)-dependent dehydrogenase (short-subunit alcohol dehydrogenase family)